ncbi:MAG: serpin family protein [Clostridia bacterium]|nr:serpin family protein [Clostridia bacterium]
MLKRLLSAAMALLMAAALVGCSQTEAPSQHDSSASKSAYINKAGKSAPIAVYASSTAPEISAEYSARYTEVNNSFAARMANSVDPGANCVFSPFSLQIALQVLAAGGNEETEKAVLDSICPGLTREDVKASSAKLIEMLARTKGFNMNSAVVANNSYMICEEFANTAADYYRASVGAIDFSDPQKASQQINKWICENTDGLVKELVDNLGPDTVMVILNALTLKLEWEKPFNALKDEAEFRGAEGSAYVPMISSSDAYEYGAFDEGEMLLVPYKGGDYKLAVILPAKDMTPAAAAAALMGRFGECLPSNVLLKMPKIKIDTKLDIIPMAKKLGIEPAVNGIYTRLVSSDSASVTRILQGASLSVDEYGTMAAAATAIIASKGVSLPAEREFVCDRPYAMVIYHADTGAVMFVSTVNNVG